MGFLSQQRPDDRKRRLAFADRYGMKPELHGFLGALMKAEAFGNPFPVTGLQATFPVKPSP